MVSLIVFGIAVGEAEAQDASAVSEVNPDDAVSSLFSKYYNDGIYTKNTKIYVDTTEQVLVDEIGAYFHASVPTTERTTYYSADALWMSRGNGQYSYYGTAYEGEKAVGVTNATATTPYVAPDNAPVVLKGEGKNSMDEYYVTLKDFKDNPGTGWGVAGKYYVSTDARIIDNFRLFTAPLWLNTDESKNYIHFFFATVEVINNDLVMKLWTSEADSGKLIDTETEVVDGVTYYVFSQANISSTTKLYFAPGVWAENDATFGIRVWNDEKEEIFRPVALGESGYYEIEYSVGMNNVEFVRYDSTTSEWWNGSPQLEIPSSKNLFVITSWSSYLWDEYLTDSNAGAFKEGENLYLQLNGDWSSAASVSSFVCQLYGESGDTDVLVLERVDSEKNIYKVTIPAGQRHVIRFAQANPSNKYEIWNITDYIYCDTDVNTNLVVLSSGWTGMIGYWSSYSE